MKVDWLIYQRSSCCLAWYLSMCLATLPRSSPHLRCSWLGRQLVGASGIPSRRRRSSSIVVHSSPAERTWRAVCVRPGGALLLGVGLSATMAQMAMTRAYRVGKVLVVANLQYTGIIFSSLWGMLLWGDSFDWKVWLGMVVILVSGVAATFYNTKPTPRGAAVSKTDPIASEV